MAQIHAIAPSGSTDPRAMLLECADNVPEGNQGCIVAFMVNGQLTWRGSGLTAMEMAWVGLRLMHIASGNQME